MLTIGGFAAAVGAVVTVIFQLFPGAAPDPPADTFRASVAVVRVEPDVPLRAFIASLSPSARVRAERQQALLGDRASEPTLMALRGTTVFVRSTLEGFKGQAIQLRWSLMRGATDRRVHLRGFEDVQAATVTADAPVDQTVQPVWIPPLPGPQLFYVRVALYDPRDVLLALNDSKPFRRSSRLAPPGRPIVVKPDG